MQVPSSNTLPQRVVVTGASSGIGLAVTRSLIEAGSEVVGIDIAMAAHVDRRYRHLRGDLSTLEGIGTVASKLKTAHCDAFVHAAGIMRSDAHRDMARSLGASLWALHVVAPQRLCALLLPAMPDRTGRVVMLSSRASAGRAGRTLYAASKAGSEALVRSMALEVMDRGITVNAVAPGPVETAQTTDPDRADAPVALPPMGRLIAPDEIAATVLFLLSDAAGAITGQTVVQCGGLSLAPPSPGVQQEGAGHEAL
jgi:NAD(P)-dependent dehydrogenase (short-subunit alcohol dehydrogenase family)